MSGFAIDSTMNGWKPSSAPAPTVSSVQNASGPWRATANVLVGTNFAAGGSLAVELSTDDGSTWHACTSVSVTDSTHVAFTTPVETVNADGAHTRIRYTNGDGQQATLGAYNYWVIADPFDFSGFVGEYEGDNLTISGSNVTAWPDGSGSGNNVTPPGTNPQKVAAGSLALPYVSFNGSSDYLKIASMALGGSGDLSMFQLVRFKSNGETVPLSYDDLTAVRVYNTTTQQLWRAATPGCTPMTVALNRWLRESGVWRAAGTEATWTNGKDHQTSSVGGVIGTTGKAFAIGARSSGGLPSPIDCAATLVYNTDQSANHAPIEEYLRIKYWGGVGAPIQSLTLSTTSPTSLDATKIVSFGELDVEGSGPPTFNADDGAPVAQDVYLFAATSTEGEMSLRFSSASSNPNFILKVRGTDVLTLPGVDFDTGDDFAWRVWYRQSTNECGLRIWVNGAFQEIRDLSSGDALVAPTVAWLGGDTSGAHSFGATYTSFTAHRGADLALLSPEFLMLGDSISTGYKFGHAPAAWLYTNNPARKSKPGAAVLGIAGAHIADQLATFQASEFYGVSSVKAVFIQVGINDVWQVVYTTVAAFVAAYQALVDQVRTAFPGAKIYGLELAPCKAFLAANAGYPATYVMWQGVNQAIGGGGGTPVTGLDRVISSHVAALNDGSDNLAAAYDIGDGLHPNEPGRQVIGLAIRAALLADGIVT